MHRQTQIIDTRHGVGQREAPLDTAELTLEYSRPTTHDETPFRRRRVDSPGIGKGNQKVLSLR